MVRKILIVAEVSLILVLFFYLKGVLKSSGFGDWQEPVFGAAILSSCLLFFVLPLSTLFVTHCNPGVYGLTASVVAPNFGDQTQAPVGPEGALGFGGEGGGRREDVPDWLGERGLLPPPPSLPATTASGGTPRRLQYATHFCDTTLATSGDMHDWLCKRLLLSCPQQCCFL